MSEQQLMSRPIPSIPEFRKLGRAAQADALRAGYRSMVEMIEAGLTDRVKKRKQLLQQYISEAHLTDEEALEICVS